MNDRLAFALQAAEEAGNHSLQWFGQGHDYEEKEDGSPVSEADRSAEALLRRRIHEKFPGEAILGEEEGLTGSGDTRWVIDPIDGTKSFVSGVPLFATLLSYEVEGISQLGVAFFPALPWMMWASLGGGAFSDGNPCRVSSLQTLDRAVLCCAGHRSMAKTGHSDQISKLSMECMATRTWCDAYGHCLVAAGQAEAMIDPVVMPYDVSAIRLLVNEAGGRCTTFAGAEHPEREALSSNGHLHQRLIEALRS